jgi:hypothetical protein
VSDFQRNAYRTCGIIVGGLTFVGAWIYAISTYGFFLGVGLGWLPAIVIGLIAGALWPLPILLVLAFVFVVLQGSR